MFKISALLVLLVYISNCKFSEPYLQKQLDQGLDHQQNKTQDNNYFEVDLYKTTIQDDQFLRVIQIQESSDLWIWSYQAIIKIQDYIFGKSQEMMDLESELSELEAAKFKISKRTKLKAISNPYDINNIGNTAYSTYLYMGTQAKQVNLLFNTGSDWMVVISSSCGSSCTSGSTYDKSTSTAYVQLSSAVYQLSYGTGSIQGYDSTDNVYLDSTKSAGLTSYEFLLAYSATGVSPFSGILGMSRNQPYTETGKTHTRGPIFYNSLKSQSLISKNTFSIFMGTTITQSKIIYGAADFATYSRDQNLKADLTVLSNFFWSVYCTGMWIKSPANKSFGFTDPGLRVIFDTSTSLNYIPSSVGTTLTYYALSGNTYYYKQDKNTYIDCATSLNSLPTIYLYIQGYWFGIPPQTYIIETTSPFTGNPLCLFGFVEQDTNDYWIMGDVFLQNYYQYYDDDNGILSMAPRAGGYIQDLERGNKSTFTFSNWERPEVFITVSVSLSFLGAGGIVIGVLFAIGIMNIPNPFSIVFLSENPITQTESLYAFIPTISTDQLQFSSQEQDTSSIIVIV